MLAGLEQPFRVVPDITLIARCRNADEALCVVRTESPDLLVPDLMMPGASGMELLRALNGERRQTRVVLLTAVADDDQLLDAIRLGAQAIVLKDMAPQVLLEAIREVHAGGQWLETGLGGRALRRLLTREQRASEAAQSRHRRSALDHRGHGEGARAQHLRQAGPQWPHRADDLRALV